MCFWNYTKVVLGYLVSSRRIEAGPNKITALANIRSLRCIKKVQQLNKWIAELSHFISKCRKKCFPFSTLEEKKDYLWSEECKHAFQFIKEYIGKAPFLKNLTIHEVLYLYPAFKKKKATSYLWLLGKGNNVQYTIWIIPRQEHSTSILQ